MASVNYLLKNIHETLKIIQQSKNAEKSQVSILRDAAQDLFKSSYDEYLRMQSRINTYLPNTYDHAELHVSLAEVAFVTDNQKIARNILERFFQTIPQEDQFYCRAKLLMGMIVDFEAMKTNGLESIRRRKVALSHILVAIDVASSLENASRYKFLVFNSSVIAWRIFNPFLKPGRAKYFVEEIKKISLELERADDPNISWRSTYQAASGFCFDDNKQSKEASDALDRAIEHSSKVLGEIMAEEQKISDEIGKYTSESESILTTLRQIEEYESSKVRKKKIDPDAEEEEDGTDQGMVLIADLPPLEGLATLGVETLKKSLEFAHKRKSEVEEKLRDNTEKRIRGQEGLTRLYMQRVHVNPPDSKRVASLPQVVQNSRMKLLVLMQCVTSGCVLDKEAQATFNQIVKELQSSPPSPLITETLLDVSRSAWNAGLRDVAIQCSDLAEKSSFISPIIRLKIDLSRAIRLVADIAVDSAHQAMQLRLTTSQVQGYGISKRLEAVKLLERILTMCQSRSFDSALVQEIAVVVWNTILPLLTPQLRMHVHRLLQQTTILLESIGSPLSVLRTQLHFELSKCEEQDDFVVRALEEAEKARACDYGELDPSTSAESELDRNRRWDHIIQPKIEVLNLRSNVYSSPSDVDSQVQLIVQQIKESTSRKFQIEMLNKALWMMVTYAPPDSVNLPQSSSPRDVNSFQVGSMGIDSKAKGNNNSYKLPELSIDDLASIFDIPRTETRDAPPALTQATTASQPAKGKPSKNDKNAIAPPATNLPPTELTPSRFDSFSKLTQRRVQIMFTLAQLAQSLGSTSVLEYTLRYVLSYVWDPKDMFLRELLDQQIKSFYLLANTLVTIIANTPVDPESKADWQFEKDRLVEQNSKNNKISLNEDSAVYFPDPHALGVQSQFCSEEINRLKTLVIRALEAGLSLSIAAGDHYGAQNSIVYFWNLHLHIFRYGLYESCTEEVYQFLKSTFSYFESISSATPSSLSSSSSTPTAFSSTGSDSPSSLIDPSLRLSIYEVYSRLNEVKGLGGLAMEVALKGCSDPTQGNQASIFLRRKLCETVYRMTTNQLISSTDLKSKPQEYPKFDHPLLTVYGLLAQIEFLSFLPKEESAVGIPIASSKSGLSPQATAIAEIPSLISRILNLMNNEVSTALKALDWKNLAQENYDQLMEMQAECWTRLTRIRICEGDVLGGQEMAEKCISLVTEGLVDSDARNLSAHVWRWISVCERYFGDAIIRTIREEGQDISLRNELRLSALRHFVNTCNFAQRAKREELTIIAAMHAWNVDLTPITSPAVRRSLFSLYRQVLDILLQCNPETKHVGLLLQQFYLSIIDLKIQEKSWDEALKIVFESFDHVPISLQKPLWKWRVVVMSKKGKNVLDGLQKLKEKDSSLQARVYGILARSSSNEKNVLEAFAKAISILSDDMERIDYMLETAQWMASSGVPKINISELLQSALDVLYEQEECLLPADSEDPVAGNDNASHYSGSQHSASRSTRSKTPSITKKIGPGSTGGGGGGGGGSRPGSTVARSTGARSTISTLEPSQLLASKLNFKDLEQGFRTNVMLGLLESNTILRIQKMNESVYFILRSLSLFSDSVCVARKVFVWNRMKESERQELKFDLFSISDQEVLDLLIPINPLILLTWIPSELLMETVGVMRSTNSMFLPSPLTLASLPLTIHYAFKAIDLMEREGLPQKSLLIIGWLRMLLFFVDSPVQHAILASLHAKSLNLLLSAGLVDEAFELKKISLGNSSTTFAKFLKTYNDRRLDSKDLEEVSSKSEALSNPNDTNIKAKKAEALGFNLFTETLNLSDSASFVVRIAQDILKLGHCHLACSLAATAELQFKLQGNLYGLLQTSFIRAQVSYIHGDYRRVLATSLLTDTPLSSIGDARLLSEVVCLTIQGYLKINRQIDAREVAKGALSMLESQISFPVIFWNNNTETEEKNKAQSLTHTQIRITEPESDSVVVEAAAQITMTFIDVLLFDAERHLEAGKDIRVPFQEMIDILNSMRGTVIKVCGEISLVHAQLLEKQCAVATNFLQNIQTTSSRFVSLEVYNHWVKERFSSAISSLVTATNIRRRLLSLVPMTDVLIEDKAGNFKSFNSFNLRQLAISELNLCAHFQTLSSLSNDDQNRLPRAIIPASEMNIIDKFLDETKQPSELLAHDFSLLPLSQASQLSVSSMQLLSGTDYEVEARTRGLIVNVRKLFSKGNFDPLWTLPHSFRPDSPLPSSHNPTGPLIRKASLTQARSFPTLTAYCEIPSITLSPDAESARMSLASSTMAAISARRFSAAINGAQTLIEAFGPLQPQRAAYWTLILQSLNARQWLEEVWESSLLPTGEVACSLNRLKVLEVQISPSPEAQKQREVELNFLQQTSVSWRRLNVSADPASILKDCVLPAGAILAGPASTAALTTSSSPSPSPLSAPAPTLTQSVLSGGGGCIVMCIQTCPLQQILYVTVGTPVAPPGFTPTSQSIEQAQNQLSEAPGLWCTERMILSEQQRRQIQILKHQQQAWRENVFKFISVFGESMPMGSDAANFEGRYPDKKIRKSENAIEESLRAMTLDLESLLSPLLGPTSRISLFLQELVQSIRYVRSPVSEVDGSTSATEHKAETHSKGGKDKTKGSTTQVSPNLTPATPASEASPPVPEYFPPPALLLLVDPTMQTLPWEALSALSPFQDLVVRDFSIHLFAHRFKTFLGDSSSPSVAPSGGGKGATKNIQPALNAGCISTTSALTFFISDPNKDDTGYKLVSPPNSLPTPSQPLAVASSTSISAKISTPSPLPIDRPSISEIVENLTNEMSSSPSPSTSTTASTSSSALTNPSSTHRFPAALGGRKWKKIGTQGDGVLALQDWISLSHEGSGPKPASLFLYSPGSLGNLLNPLHLSGMNLERLALFLCCDQAQTDPSFRRQCAIDNLKFPNELNRENPLSMAALLSLAGTGSVLVHQWSTSMAAQVRFVEGFWEAFGKGKCPLLQSLARAANAPHVQQISLAPLNSPTIATSAPPPLTKGKSVRGDKDKDKGHIPLAAPVSPRTEQAADAEIPQLPPTPTKKWIKFCRIAFGLPNVVYSDGI